VADETRTSRPARARAVAELPADALLARAEELARRWAIALILDRPLKSISEVPLEDLAREAPSLCALVLHAVQSDVALERLIGLDDFTGRANVGAGRLTAVCGAGEAAALVEAVEALRGVLWEALLDQLTEPSARLLADIGDRLAYVCASLLATALASPIPDRADQALGHDVRATGEIAEAPVSHEPIRVSSPPGEVVIIDERAPEAERVAAAAPGHVAAAGSARSWERSRPWDEPPSAPADKIEIRDERREGGPTAWISSIGAQLERFERDSRPFAVLLVELVELERLRRQEPPEGLLRLAERLEQALAAALGSRSGSLTRERPGRCWLLVPGTDRAGAEHLAERLLHEPRMHADARSTRFELAIGIAVCPEDGREPAALAAYADVGLYAARLAQRASLARHATHGDKPA
jgi:GGDEF domain-containing protein